MIGDNRSHHHLCIIATFHFKSSYSMDKMGYGTDVAGHLSQRSKDKTQFSTYLVKLANLLKITRCVCTCTCSTQYCKWQEISGGFSDDASPHWLCTNATQLRPLLTCFIPNSQENCKCLRSYHSNKFQEKHKFQPQYRDSRDFCPILISKDG